MKRIRTLQLARTGIHGTQSAQLTKQDFAEMIETFHQSPVYLGHDASHKDSEPSYGKVIELSLSDDGETLYGDVVLEPEVDVLFSEKKYDGWSIGCPRRRIDNKRVLHHLALLGSTKPAIPNLRQVKVTQSEYAEEISAAEYTFSGEMPEFKENTQEDSSMTEEEKKKMEALEAENKQLKEAAEKRKKDEEEAAKAAAASAAKQSGEFADLTKRCEQLEAENRKARIDGFLGKMSEKIPAAVLPKVAALAGQFADAAECEFTDGTETKSSSALDLFADVLCAGFKENGAVTKQVFHPDASDFSDAKGDDGKSIDWNNLAGKM